MVITPCWDRGELGAPWALHTWPRPPLQETSVSYGHQQFEAEPPKKLVPLPANIHRHHHPPLPDVSMRHALKRPSGEALPPFGIRREPGPWGGVRSPRSVHWLEERGRVGHRRRGFGCSFGCGPISGATLLLEPSLRLQHPQLLPFPLPSGRHGGLPLCSFFSCFSFFLCPLLFPRLFLTI